jgi:hypothetical protein
MDICVSGDFGMEKVLAEEGPRKYLMTLKLKQF